MGYRYIGSKDKLASTIIRKIRRYNPEAHTIIDLMAGTGLFSLALRKQGYRVVASDVMTYSYHHLVVNLLLNSAPEFINVDEINDVKSTKNRYQKVLDYLNALPIQHGFFFEEFGPDGIPAAGCKPRMYFSAHNAGKIDSIREVIKTWHKNGKINDIEHSLLLHNLIMAANDIANIAGTYGYFLSHFVQRATEPIVLAPITFDEDNNILGHEIRRGYAEDLAHELHGDVCYIDPPYIKRQYAANYHILETIAREDEPEAIGVSGLRPWRDQYSNFCSKINIRKSFENIITEINCNELFISYSEDGLLSLEEMTSFLSKFGKLSIDKIKYKRFKSNKSKKSPFLEEYLFHLTKI